MASSANEVIYSRAFFDLQIQLARRVTLISGLPLERTLLDYTHLYKRLGAGRDFEASSPTWQSYLAGLRDAEDAADWTHSFYLTRLGKATGPTVVAEFGCFSYAVWAGNRIKLHFRNAERGGHSPLGIDRVVQRRADLTALFTHLKQTLGDGLQVLGASWLYNLEAYRRLFPPSYLSSARVYERGFQRMPLWGQFLDRRGETKPRMTRPFLKRLERQSDLENLNECFPLQLLTVEASVSEFFRFYGI